MSPGKIAKCFAGLIGDSNRLLVVWVAGFALDRDANRRAGCSHSLQGVFIVGFTHDCDKARVIGRECVDQSTDRFTFHDAGMCAASSTARGASLSSGISKLC